MQELPDSDLEHFNGGAEKVALLGPLIISAIPILFPPKKVQEAREQLAAARQKQRR